MSMRWYESVLIVLVIWFIWEYFGITHNFAQWIIFGVGFLSLFFMTMGADEEDLNIDRRYIYAIIAFLFNPLFTYLHYVYNMPFYGMNPSDFTDINFMFGRAAGAFLFVSSLGLLTLLFKPKRKWETYWLVTMIISIIMGSLVISSNSF